MDLHLLLYLAVPGVLATGVHARSCSYEDALCASGYRSSSRTPGEGANLRCENLSHTRARRLLRIAVVGILSSVVDKIQDAGWVRGGYGVGASGVACGARAGVSQRSAASD